MTAHVRVFLVLGLVCGSVALEPTGSSMATAAEIRLRERQWQQLVDKRLAEQSQQASPATDAEIKAMQLRVSELHKIDASTAQGQDQLMTLIEDSAADTYVRTTAFAHLAQAEIRRLKQIDATAADGQAKLLEVLNDSETPSSIRQAVLVQLAKAHARSPAMRQAVLRLVRGDVEKQLCRSAIYSLQSLGVPAVDAVPALIPMLDDHFDCGLRKCGSNEISDVAADVLGAYGPAAAGAIPRLAWEIDPANRWPHDPQVAQYALGRIAPDQFPFFVEGAGAIKPLIKELASDIWGRRLRAAERLLELHEHAGAATAALETALHDENRLVRATAAAAILRMQPHEGAGNVLAPFAKSEDLGERAMLIRWLCDCELNFDDGEVLRGFLSDADPQIRSNAAKRLAKTDRHTAEALAAVVALYKLGGHANQFAALQALDSFPPELISSTKDLIAEATTQPGSVGSVAKRIQKRKFSAEAADQLAK